MSVEYPNRVHAIARVDRANALAYLDGFKLADGQIAIDWSDQNILELTLVQPLAVNERVVVATGMSNTDAVANAIIVMEDNLNSTEDIVALLIDPSGIAAQGLCVVVYSIYGEIGSVPINTGV